MHDLERPYARPDGIMKGYSGHLPISKSTRSGPFEDHDEVSVSGDRGSDNDDDDDEEKTGGQVGQFRKLGEHMDTLERYETARQELFHRGQSQEMLMRLVQAKLSERVSSYAQQHIWLRNLFSNFDGDGSDGLDEAEFRQCLELMNVQFGMNFIYHVT